MSTPCLFLIIPVFNQERHLKACLDSVVSQEHFSKCQVIIVNDGSTDGSQEICECYAGRYRNIALIATENNGLGAARNRGLKEIPEAATGFVTFLDSDDYWDPGFVASSIDCMAGAPDVIAGQIRGTESTPDWPWLELFRGSKRWCSTILDAPILYRDVSCCNKIFSLRLVRQLGLRFSEGRHFEDLWFAPEALIRASGVVINPGAVYRYRMGESSSIMSNAFHLPRNYWDHLAGAEHILSLREGLPSERQALIEDLAVFANQWFIHRASGALQSAELERYYSESGRVYSGISTARIIGATTSWAARRSYLALAASDFPRLRLTAPSLDEADVVNGTVHYGDRFVGQGASSVSSDLESDFRVRAWLGYFDVLADGVDFFGHVQVPGMAIEVAPAGIYPALRVAGVTYMGEWHRRGDSLASSDPTQEWSGFRVHIAGEGFDLPAGRHAVQFVLIDARGREREASCQLQANGGYLREARLIELADANLVPVTDDSNWVVFLVGLRHRRLNRVLWRFARARGALREQQPFAKIKLVASLLALMPGRPVWLLAERESTAQDNSAAFFRYLRTEQRNVNAYYVIDSDAKQRERVADLGNVVDRGSWKHVCLLLRAQVLISAFDIDRYLLPPQWNPEVYRRYLAWFLGTPRVFLNHGVSYTDVSQSLSRRYVGASLFVTSSHREADYVRDRMDYSAQVVSPGLPRFDLLDRHCKEPRRVLFMPTWRSYLQVGEESSDERAAFLQSHYWRFISAVLGSPSLASTLEKEDLLLEVYPHYEVSGIIGLLSHDADRIVVSDQAQRSVREAIADASLFVTDWTSVFFDAAYVGLPIIHAPFDTDEFLTHHYRPGFFDLEDDGFGPVVQDPNDLVDAIARYAENGFAREAVYEARADAFFARKGGHSEAVYGEIKRMLQRQR